MFRGRRRRKLGKGVVAGIAGGLAASFVMNQFQQLWIKLEQSSNGSGRQQQGPQQVKTDEADDATIKAGAAVVEPVLDRRLTKEEKKTLGPVVHYAFGTGMGAVYGAAAEFKPLVRSGFGAGYGTAVFLAADEIGVPLMGLSKPPQEVPLSKHLYAWASHVVYGTTLEGVRRLVRKAM